MKNKLKSIKLTAKLIASFVWYALMIIVFVRNIFYGEEPTNSQSLILILLYLMIWMDKDAK